MASKTLDELLQLPSAERAEIAMALWESLDDDEREAAIELTDDQKAELDRRWAAYQANPDSAISLDEMVRRLKARRAAPHPV
jgi:putative addiction module component (TIGR02574 family)